MTDMQISLQERKRATQLIRRLTPSAPLYKKYEKAATDFIADFKRAKRDIPANMIEVYSLKMVRSELFKRDYLVAFVSEGWFGQVASHCNAIASPSLSLLDLSSPPLIVIPGKSVPRSRGFSSIVEHEFVHVNQGISGRFPNLNACELKEDVLFEELMNVTQAEFEANFIQLVRDQTLTPDNELGVGLEKWCLIRGYTQGLELTLLRMTTEDFPVAQEKKFLKRLRDDLAEAFASRGLNKEVGQNFADDIEQMSKIAMLNLNQCRPDITRYKNFGTLFKWLFRKEIEEQDRGGPS